MWRRRNQTGLGAPPREKSLANVPVARGTLLCLTLALLSMAMPLFGLTLITVIILDRATKGFLPSVRLWLGLKTNR